MLVQREMESWRALSEYNSVFGAPVCTARVSNSGWPVNWWAPASQLETYLVDGLVVGKCLPLVEGGTWLLAFGAISREFESLRVRQLIRSFRFKELARYP